MLTRRQPVPGFMRLRKRAVPQLIVSYCRACGLVVAASPYEHMLAAIERVHRCPVYHTYPPVEKRV